VTQVINSVKDEELRRWWQRQDNKVKTDFERRAETVLSRLNDISIDPQLRAILGQSKSTVKIADVMSKGEILLCNLKGIDAGAADLVASLMVTEAWQAAQTTFKDKPVFLMMDEGAGWVDIGIPLDTMQAQARKENMPIIFAQQFLGQSPQQIREGTITNMRNKVILQSSSLDARMLLPELGSKMDIEDITNQPAYQAIARVETPTGSSSPVTIRTLPPDRRTNNATEVVRLSRERDSTPIEDVWTEISDRRTVKPSGPRPKIGSAE
jgi:type IV secretory pathway VirB4 component